MKVSENNISKCPYITERTLTAHRVNRHSSATNSPFMMMDIHEQILPIDIKYNLDINE